MHIDTDGRERVRRVTSSYYRGADIFFVVFDVTDRESFENSRHWLSEIEKYAKDDVLRVGVGIKIDETDKRVVDENVALEFFSSYKIPYYEASARTGQGVNEVFIDAVRTWLNRCAPVSESCEKEEREEPSPKPLKKDKGYFIQ